MDSEDDLDTTFSLLGTLIADGDSVYDPDGER